MFKDRAYRTILLLTVLIAMATLVGALPFFEIWDMLRAAPPGKAR